MKSFCNFCLNIDDEVIKKYTTLFEQFQSNLSENLEYGEFMRAMDASGFSQSVLSKTSKFNLEKNSKL